MSRQTKEQWSTQKTEEKFDQDAYLPIWIEAFLRDRKAQNMAKGTLYFYEKKLALFAQFAQTRAITLITDITPDDLRTYLLWLEETEHNGGGIHACYRALRTFLYWWEGEIEPEGWTNPIRKVKAPRLAEDPLDPVETKDVGQMVGVCERGTFYGDRDRAMILTLLDTGIRAAELLGLNLEDLDTTDGSILVRRGKGSKPRMVFAGKKVRKALRAWIKRRGTKAGPLFITQGGDRLTYWGLRQMIDRRAQQAEIEKPSAHDFRRAFCLAQLDAGTPETTIARLMGHKDTKLIARYAKQSKRHLEEGYRSVVDEQL